MAVQTGRFAEIFQRNLARFVGVRSATLVNSGLRPT
jgi:dTDP-4-amino-4,6-dideoxygalactose transaminase